MRARCRKTVPPCTIELLQIKPFRRAAGSRRTGYVWPTSWILRVPIGCRQSAHPRMGDEIGPDRGPNGLRVAMGMMRDAMRQSSTLDRRLFIKAASRFVGATAAAGGLLSLGPSMPGARSQPKARAPEPLIQPPE